MSHGLRDEFEWNACGPRTIAVWFRIHSVSLQIQEAAQAMIDSPRTTPPAQGSTGSWDNSELPDMSAQNVLCVQQATAGCKFMAALSAHHGVCLCTEQVKFNAWESHRISCP